MKLFFSPASPYVRKVMVVAHETGQADRIEHLPSAAGPVQRDRTIVAKNPIGKVPTAYLDDGRVLYDSRVICEYLDAQSKGAKVFPAAGPARWDALTEQALGDGLLDAALLIRYEDNMRPEALRWDGWRGGQMEKIVSCLEVIETSAPKLGQDPTIGTITIGCALGYLDFRFPDLGWRKGRDAAAAWFETFGQRPSMAATQPKA